MSEHDMHTLTGAYAAHALPDDERSAFDDHLEQCPACRQEVAELVATTARLGSAVAAPAPAAMKSRVLAEAARTRQLSPVVTGLHKRPGAQPWFRQPLAVAASFLLVVAVGLGAFAGIENRRANQAQDEKNRVVAIATDPQRSEASRDLTSGGTGTLIVSGDQAIFRARDVKDLPSGSTYQLWIINGKGAHSAGVLGRAPSGDLQQFVEGVKPTDQIGLTVEPGGGSAKPTTKPVLVLPVPA